jgi:hypothetical protein
MNSANAMARLTSRPRPLMRFLITDVPVRGFRLADSAGATTPPAFQARLKAQERQGRSKSFAREDRALQYARGTAERRPVAGLPHYEWRRPSRIKTQPCWRRCAISS